MFIAIPSGIERPIMYDRSNDLVVYIGRFSPFHLGHAHVIKKALETTKNLLILVGSAFKPRTIKDPWTYVEREHMISEYINSDEKGNVVFNGKNIIIPPLRDEPYNDQKWLENVQSAVEHTKNLLQIADEDKIAITGSKKDDSSYYLKYFKSWKQQFVEPVVGLDWNDKTISATDIRRIVFDNDKWLFSRHATDKVPYSVFETIERFKDTASFAELKAEYDFITDYKRSWESAPYAPTFLTVDAVVIQAGHVLMIKRRAAPGKGLWALPGGFVNQKEVLQDAIVRELREETRLKVPEPVLRGSIKSKEIFDDPNRSLRGRTVTTAFLFHLSEDFDLPEVKGYSDAQEAKWIPLAHINKMSENIFEDHLSIINTLVARLTDRR